MKKILAIAAALYLVVFGASAQDSEIRPAAIGFSFFLNDYTTPNRIRTTSLSQVLNNKQWAKPKDMGPGIAISYFKGLSKHADFATTLGGSFVKYTATGISPPSNDRFLLEGDASVNLKMTSEKYVVQPYLIAGIGGAMYGSSFGAFIPTGLGLKFNILDETHVFITTQYRIPVTTSTTNYHFFNQFGVAGRIGKKKEALKPLPPMPPPDTDQDGIIDSLDKCPTVPGIEKYQGCPVPDSDKDGINDEDDKCPSEPGVARYQGCPIPDTDKDGINDEEDKCPSEVGPMSNQGCPFKDSDGDGVIDPEDKCPNVPGIKENQGCPEIKEETVKRINYAAQNIYFASGKAVLLAKSNKGLIEVAQILKDNADTRMSIDGHTDNTGTDELNQTLSNKRSAAVKAFLVKQGVDESRLTSTGHGEAEPVADNKTATGRQKNRRVELKLGY